MPRYQHILRMPEDDAGAWEPVRAAFEWLLYGSASVPARPVHVSIRASIEAGGRDELSARVALAAGEDAAAVALGRLASRADDYHEIAAACPGARARLALQRLLLEGRLDERAFRGDGDLLGQLARIVRTPLASELDREALLSSLASDLAEPGGITADGTFQDDLKTAVITLARAHPAEYARLVAELASPAAQARLAGGAVIRRPPDWAPRPTGAAGLLLPALAPLARPDAGTLLHALTGGAYERVRRITRFNRSNAWKTISRAVASGRAVPAALRWEPGGRHVLIDKIEHGQVYVTTPQGERECIAEAAFKTRLRSADIPL